MSAERDLSGFRMAVKTEPIDQSVETPFRADVLPEVSRHLREVVLDYNFDTFCFIDDLVTKAKAGNRGLAEEYIIWTPDSEALANEYGGTNCTGLSLVLKSVLTD